MRRIKLFCEGITDQVFIADCLEKFYNLKSVRTELNNKKGHKLKIILDEFIEIIDVGGCSRLSDPIYISMLEDNTTLGGINLVIFDADYSNPKQGNNGFTNCDKKLNQIKEIKKVSFDYYIWPNDKEDGDIEALLKHLIPKDKTVIYDCIESHQNCLEKLSLDFLKKAQLKEKIGYYLYTCKLDSKPGKRDYKNSNFWNLNCAESTDLNRFKNFLDRFIKITLPKSII